MVNTIEIIIQAIDKASDIILGVEKKATASNVAIAKSFENVGIASDAVDKKLGEYGAALDKTAIAQNKLRQAQFDAQEAAQKLAQAQYNLAQNTDPTKVEGLSKELAKAQVQLDGTAQQVQKLSKDMRDGRDSTEGMGGAFSKLQAGIVVANQAMQLAGQVVQGVEKAYNATVGALINYGAKVKDLSLTLNLSTEETSKLISIGQKFGVSTEQITSALEMMTKRGMAPSIEGLAKLSDQIMAIDNPVQRAAALSEIFGRNWTSLMPILEKGGAAIKAAGIEAEKFGLVLNQKTADAIENIQIQINTLQERIDGLKIKMGGQLLPAVNNVTDALEKFANIVGGTETPLEVMRRETEYLISIYGRESDEVKAAEKAIADYSARMDSATGIIDGVDRAQQRATESIRAQQSALSSAQQAMTDYADAGERAMRRTAAAAKSSSDDMKAAAGQIADLKIAMGGAAQNEMKSYQDRQASLAEQAQKLRDQLSELESKQGTVASTTVKHAMSANELALANARLADAQARLSKEQDPAKARLLADQIAVQRDNINQANEATTKYVDNSAHIADIKDQYDKINTEIQKNADEHDVATKRIVFGYLEQELAAKGMTTQSAAALDQLAVKWGLLSKADVGALNDARIAAQTLARDGSIEHFNASAQTALADAKKPAQSIEEAAKAASRATGGLSDLVKGQSDTINKALDSTKQPSQDFITNSKAMQDEFGRSRDRAMELINYGLNPMSSTLSVLTQQVSIFSQALGSLPAVAQLLPTFVPPTYPTTGGRTYPLAGGAQNGADFVVPPNPRGGAGDYYPVITAPGERVQVTPQGQGGGGNIPAINITQNFSGAQSSPDQYRAIMYEVMNDVIRSAMSQ